MEYKPLSDLENDHEACRNLFYFFTGMQVPKIVYPGGFVNMTEGDGNGTIHEVNIWHDGDVFYTIGNEKQVMECPFRIVKKFHELGYSA